MRRYAHYRISLAGTALAAVALILAGCGEGVQQPVVEDVPPVFGFGNGAPSGPHYNLNIIGVPRDKTADMTGSGHVIFVDLWGSDGGQSKTTIKLCESGTGSQCDHLDPTEYQVLDKNGTDGEASFALPNPAPSYDPDTPGSDVPSLYSVYARPLGTPGGHAENQTCGIVEVEVTDPTTGETTTVEEEICSLVIMDLDRTKGKQSFIDATRCLLYIYEDLNPLDDDPTISRVPIFGDPLIDSWWEYTNEGLKLAQLRFYPIVGDGDVPDWPTTDCTNKGNGNGNH